MSLHDQAGINFNPIAHRNLHTHKQNNESRIFVSFTKLVITGTEFFVLAIAISAQVSATFSTTCYILRFEISIQKLLDSIKICRLYTHTCSIFLTTLSTACLLTAIAINRHRKTMAGLSAVLHLTSIKAKRISVGIFVLSVGMSISVSVNTKFDQSKQMCSLFRSQVSYIFVGVLVVNSFFMYGVVIFCYVKISVIIWCHRQNRNRVNARANNKAGNENKIPFKKSNVHPVKVLSNDSVNDREQWFCQKDVFKSASLNEQQEHLNKSQIHKKILMNAEKLISVQFSLLSDAQCNKERNMTYYAVYVQKYHHKKRKTGVYLKLLKEGGQL